MRSAHFAETDPAAYYHSAPGIAVSRVRVYVPDGTGRNVSTGELRTGVLPGWSIAVDSLFED